MFLLARRCAFGATRALLIHMLPVVGGNDLLAAYDVPVANWNQRCQAAPPAGWIGRGGADGGDDEEQ